MRNSIAAVLFLVAAVLPAQAGRYPAEEGDLVRISVQDYPKMYGNLEQSPFLRFWNSASMKDFRQPLETWFDEQVQAFQKEMNLAQKPGIRDLLKGEVQFAIPAFGISLAEEKIKGLGVYLVFDGGKGNKLADSLLASLVKRLEELEKKQGQQTRKDITFMDEKFHTFALTSTDPGDYKFPDDMQVRMGSFGGHYFLGAGTKADLEKALTRLIGAVRGPAAGGPEKKDAPAARAADDMAVLFNFRPLVPLAEEAMAEGQEKIKASAEAGSGDMALAGVELKRTLTAAGLLDLKEIRVSVNCDPAGLSTGLDLELAQASRGIWKLFLPGPELLAEPLPAWIPDDAWTASTLRVPLSGWCSTVMQFVAAEIPMAAVQMQVGLDMFKAQGVDLDKDVFQLLADTWLQVQLPASPEQKGADNNVHLLKLKDGTKFEENLQKLLAMSPLPLVPEEYMGGKIYPFPVPSAKPGAQPAVAFAKEWIMFSASKNELQRVIRLMANPPKKALADSATFQARAKALPPRCQGVTFQNTDALVKGLVLLLKRGAPGLSEAAAKAPFKLDFAKLPEPKDIDVDFGTGIQSTVGSGKGLSVKFNAVYPKK